MASSIDSADSKKKRPRRLKKVTIQDVAKASEVSATTVSLVLQNKGEISEETRKKVRAASQKLGYRYANSPDMKRTTGFIGVLIDTMENPYFTEMVEPLETVLNKEGYASVILNTYGDKKRQDHLLESLDHLNLSGLVIIPASGTDEESLKKIKATGIPFIMGIRHLGFGEFDYVGPNYFSGMQQAVRHLIDLDYKAIAFVGGEQNNTAYIERLSSFTSFMNLESIPIVPEWILSGAPVFDTGRDSVTQLFAEEPHPTAIIAYNDIVACGVIRGLRDLGLVAGKDVAVIGFDGIRQAAIHSIPITTVSTPPERIGFEL
ncbi:MAG: LacI family DNA-binding transcriptional regulator, partial [Opitutales bacterium]|nr:LacI family DNA-binding transcriptional regulator [Opitutales bacterium]